MRRENQAPLLPAPHVLWPGAPIDDSVQIVVCGELAIGRNVGAKDFAPCLLQVEFTSVNSALAGSAALGNEAIA